MVNLNQRFRPYIFEDIYINQIQFQMGKELLKKIETSLL